MGNVIHLDKSAVGKLRRELKLLSPELLASIHEIFVKNRDLLNEAHTALIDGEGGSELVMQAELECMAMLSLIDEVKAE